MRMLKTATKGLLRTHVNIIAAPFSHLHLFSDSTWDALISHHPFGLFVWFLGNKSLDKKRLVNGYFL